MVLHRMPGTASSLKRIAIVLACATLAVACKSESGAQSLAAAKSRLAKNDRPAAVIELKRALQAEPGLAEARFLLGRALLERDSAAEAVIELTKALELGHPDGEVLPVLAQALLASGQPGRIVMLASSLASPAASADPQFATSLALAHAAMGDEATARGMIDSVLQAQPGFGPAMLIRGRLLANQGDRAGAMATVERLLATSTNDADALLLKGELLAAGGDEKAAEQAYRSALKSRPDHPQAAAALLSMLLDRNDLVAVRAELATLQKFRPRQLQTLYFEARLAYAAGDFKSANNVAQQLAGLAGDNPQILQLAGAAALRLHQLQQAEKQLSRLTQLAPSYAPGWLLLARTRLTAGKPDMALAALQPLLDRPAPEAKALAMAADAHLMKGNERAAVALFSQASALSHAGSRTALAMDQVTRGDTSAGLGRLEEIARSDPSPTADFALVTARVMQRDYTGALAALDALERKQPRTPQTLHLRAQVLARLGDVPQARLSFEKALAMDPDYFAAVDALAALDLREKKPKDARARFERLLKANARNAQALLAMAAIDEESGKPKAEIAKLLVSAVQADPLDPMTRRRLIGYHLGKQDGALALAAARDAASALPGDPLVLEGLALAQFAVGETTQALASYNRLVAMSPKSAEAQLGLAKAYLSAKNTTGAEKALRSALEIAPGSAVVVQRAAALYVLAGRHADALKLAAGLRLIKVQAAAADELVGDIEASRGAWQAAASAYRAAISKQPSPPLATRLYSSLRQTDKAAALAFSSTWSTAHPEDLGFQFHLGDAALEAKDYAAAEAVYLGILKNRPDNAPALNNLAWAMHMQKKPGAEARASRANELLPDQPAMMDTWAVLLADDNRLTEALALQRRAVGLAPQSPALRLNLARIQLKAGDKAGARVELDKLRSLGDRFNAHKDVEELLGQT